MLVDEVEAIPKHQSVYVKQCDRRDRGTDASLDINAVCTKYVIDTHSRDRGEHTCCTCT